MKSFILSIFIFILFESSFGQGARIVINGAYINIENAAQLVIDNPQSNAINRTALGGHIISEHENDVVKWNIGQRNDTYFVPFGVSNTHYLPLYFTTNGGVGDGYFELATYGGPTYLNSSYLPTGITNFVSFSGSDNSPYVMDRFWKLKARDYSNANEDRPSFHFLQLSYRDSEHTNVGNVINEADVFIQRYNPIIDSWYDYIPGGGVVSSDVINNTVSVYVVPNDEIFDWWVIVDKISPLPVDLLSFEAKAVDNMAVYLEWITASSENVDRYIIEKSINAIDWEFVLETEAVNALDQIKYSGVDTRPYTGLSYYRLKYYEMDGSFYYSDVRSVFIQEQQQFTYLVYPNPTQKDIFVKLNEDHSYRQLVVYDVQGRVVLQKDIVRKEKKDLIDVDVSKLPQGSYIIQLQSDHQVAKTSKFVKL